MTLGKPTPKSRLPTVRACQSLVNQRSLVSRANPALSTDLLFLLSSDAASRLAAIGDQKGRFTL